MLATLDGRGPPFVTSKLTQLDGNVSTSQITFDSVYISSDSDFVRAFELDDYVQPPGGPPQLIQSTSKRVAGTILLRGDEVVLATPPTFFEIIQPGYFTPSPRTLRARLQTSEYLCTGSFPCEIVFNHFVDAIYTRR